MFTNFRNIAAEILSSEIRSTPLSKFKKGQQCCPNSRGVSRTPHLPMVQRRTNRTHRTRQVPQMLVFRHARSLNRHGRPDRPSIITGPLPSCPALHRHARLRPGISLIPSKTSIPSVGWNNTIHVIVATIFDFHLWQSMKLYNFTKILELCVRLSSTTYIKKNG